MSEGQVRQLLTTLQGNVDTAANPAQAIAFSAGVAALEMVLEGASK